MAKLTQSDILKAIEEMSVLDLSELVKAIEEKFDVKAQAPLAVAAASAGAGVPAEEVSEQTVFNVEITETGAQKLSVIKALRELVPTLGLKEAKDLVDAAPNEVMTAVNKTTAQEAKKKLEDAGAKVTLK